MTWLWIGSLVVISAAGLVLAQTSFANGKTNRGSQGNATDPQLLMIPRWFLSSLTVQGREVQLPTEKHLTLQFAKGDQANGEGGCNSFGSSYTAGKDGSLTFGHLISTRMACEGGMDQERAYFNALSQVK